MVYDGILIIVNVCIFVFNNQFRLRFWINIINSRSLHICLWKKSYIIQFDWMKILYSLIWLIHSQCIQNSYDERQENEIVMTQQLQLFGLVYYPLNMEPHILILFVSNESHWWWWTNLIQYLNSKLCSFIALCDNEIQWKKTLACIACNEAFLSNNVQISRFPLCAFNYWRAINCS